MSFDVVHNNRYEATAFIDKSVMVVDDGDSALVIHHQIEIPRLCQQMEIYNPQTLSKDEAPCDLTMDGDKLVLSLATLRCVSMIKKH